jgi:hypothetical protein
MLVAVFRLRRGPSSFNDMSGYARITLYHMLPADCHRQ